MKSHKSHFAIHIQAKWRVCFRWQDGGADDVEIVDDHGQLDSQRSLATIHRAANLGDRAQRLPAEAGANGDRAAGGEDVDAEEKARPLRSDEPPGVLRRGAAMSDNRLGANVEAVLAEVDVDRIRRGPADGPHLGRLATGARRETPEALV